MRLFLPDVETRRDVLVALCRLPEAARRFALERVAFASVGRAVAGLALGPRCIGGCSWVVPLAEREGVYHTLAHEVAHALLDHQAGTAEHERDAALLARAWGFGGPSADPESCVVEFEAAEARRGVPVRALVAEGLLRFECRCGVTCRVIAPTAAGLAAEVGVECVACGWVEVAELSRVACVTCGARAVVTWSEGATPEAPAADWACACGARETLRVATEPPAAPELPAQERAARDALRELTSLADCVRRIAALAEPGALAVESCRAGAWRARDGLLRASRLLEGDTRGATLAGLATGVTLAGRLLDGGDLAGAVEQLASLAVSLEPATQDVEV